MTLFMEFLLAGDKPFSVVHLGQLVFTYIACGSFGFNKILLFNKMIKQRKNSKF